MKLPETNKIHQEPLDEAFGANAALLEKKLSEVKWRNLVRLYLCAVLLLMVTLFGVVFSVKLALFIFTL